MTKEEWIGKGKQLFGDNFEEWRFVCPGCGHIQSVGDFRIFKDRGATPESAREECIGRYTGGRSWMLGEGGSPCDYAGYGLLRISPVEVVDGEEVFHCFAFDEKEAL